MSAKRGDAGRRTASGRDRMRGGCRRRDRATNEYPGCQWLTSACSMVDGQLAPRPPDIPLPCQGKTGGSVRKAARSTARSCLCIGSGEGGHGRNPGTMSRSDHCPGLPSDLHAAQFIDARSVSSCEFEVLCGGVHTQRNFPPSLAFAVGNRPSGRHDPLRDSKRFSDP